MKKILIFLSLIAVFIFTACQKDDESNISSSRDLFAMDTFMTIKAYGTNREAALSAASLKIVELENKLSVTNDKSDVWMINHSYGAQTEVSNDTANIISYALKISEKTSGALDPTIYPVLREWGFTTGEYKIPDSQRIKELLDKTDYRKVNISKNMVTLPDEMLIDLGAISKGYTSDEVADILRENNVSSAIINLGGNVQTVGSKPDGSDWRVSIRDPFDESSQMCIISVSDKAVITSGDYERYFIGEDGKKYCHIIDPTDGYPADNGLVSVTVISENGILCDCLSTALFIKGKEEAYLYWKENSGFEMILVDTEKKIYITEGISNNIEIINGMTKIILT